MVKSVVVLGARVVVVVVTSGPGPGCAIVVVLVDRGSAINATGPFHIVFLDVEIQDQISLTLMYLVWEVA